MEAKNKPYNLKINCIDDDPILQFVGEDEERDHGYFRRQAGKIWVEKGLRRVEDNLTGYFEDPKTGQKVSFL